MCLSFFLGFAITPSIAFLTKLTKFAKFCTSNSAAVSNNVTE
jgi:hypothetical protein